MSNRSVWNVQKRHEWLAKPIKRKRLKRRKRLRVGLEQALERNREANGSTEPEAAPER